MGSKCLTHKAEWLEGLNIPSEKAKNNSDVYVKQENNTEECQAFVVDARQNNFLKIDESVRDINAEDNVFVFLDCIKNEPELQFLPEALNELRNEYTCSVKTDEQISLIEAQRNTKGNKLHFDYTCSKCNISCITRCDYYKHIEICQSNCVRIMNWTETETLQFIEAYKKKPILWDFEHRLHYHKAERNEAWNKLAAEVNRSPEECRKKWEGVLASFRREKAKMRRIKKVTESVHSTEVSTYEECPLKERGDDEDYIATWYAFESLRFLLYRNKPRDSLNVMEDNAGSEANSLSQSSMTEAEKDNVGENDSEAFDSSETEEEKLVREQERINSKKSKVEEIRSKKKRKNEENKRLPNFSRASSTDAETEIFGNLVAVKLKRYDHITRTWIQNEILRVFMDADRGSFSDHFNTT